MLKYQYNDGGRADAGYKGSAGDCAVRACAIATGIPYSEVYSTLQKLQKEYIKETQDRVAKSKSARVKLYYSKVVKDGQSVRNGTYVEVLHKFFNSLGWVWTASVRGARSTWAICPTRAFMCAVWLITMWRLSTG